MFENCKLLLIGLIIVALIYLLSEDYNDKSTDKPITRNNDTRESFDPDSVINDVIKSGESASGSTTLLDKNGNNINNMDNTTVPDKLSDALTEWDNQFPSKYKSLDGVTPVGDIGDGYAGFTSSGENLNNDLTYFNSKDLLPKRDTSVSDEGWNSSGKNSWDESNPQIRQIEGENWLNERKFLAVSTVLGSHRNSSRDLRGDTYITPQFSTGPWQQSTITPDTNNRGLCSFT